MEKYPDISQAKAEGFARNAQRQTQQTSSQVATTHFEGLSSEHGPQDSLNARQNVMVKGEFSAIYKYASMVTPKHADALPQVPQHITASTQSRILGATKHVSEADMAELVRDEEALQLKQAKLSAKIQTASFLGNVTGENYQNLMEEQEKLNKEIEAFQAKQVWLGIAPSDIFGLVESETSSTENIASLDSIESDSDLEGFEVVEKTDILASIALLKPLVERFQFENPQDDQVREDLVLIEKLSNPDYFPETDEENQLLDLIEKYNGLFTNPDLEAFQSDLMSVINGENRFSEDLTIVKVGKREAVRGLFSRNKKIAQRDLNVKKALVNRAVALLPANFRDQNAFLTTAEKTMIFSSQNVIAMLNMKIATTLSVKLDDVSATSAERHFMTVKK